MPMILNDRASAGYEEEDGLVRGSQAVSPDRQVEFLPYVLKRLLRQVLIFANSKASICNGQALSSRQLSKKS